MHEVQFTIFINSCGFTAIHCQVLPDKYRFVKLNNATPGV